jgi:hypothetical protein
MSEFLVTSGLSGARERNRTADLRITSALLYRLSYSGVTCTFLSRDDTSTPLGPFLKTGPSLGGLIRLPGSTKR